MSTRNRHSHSDLRELLDGALLREDGATIVPFKAADEAEASRLAWNFSRTLQNFRKMDRERSKEIFSRDDPRWGRSDYDILMFGHKKGNTYVKIEKRQINDVFEVTAAELAELEAGRRTVGDFSGEDPT